MIKLIVLAFMVVAATAEDLRAIVILLGPNNNNFGNITFRQVDDGAVRMVGTVTRLPAGPHGFHVHEKGDLSKGCTTAGGHFNPLKAKHGAPTAEDRHAGDLGNIVANADGVAFVDITDENMTLCAGPLSIIGRAVVVHALADDLGLGGQTDSLTTGHAGARLACGVIGIVSPTGSWPAAKTDKNAADTKNSAPSTVSSLLTTALTAISIAFLRI